MAQENEIFVSVIMPIRNEAEFIERVLRSVLDSHYATEQMEVLVVDGLLHKVGDADDLAKCILKIHDNPEMIVNAAQRNRKKVVEQGDRKTNMKRLSSIYENLVSQTERKTI